MGLLANKPEKDYGTDFFCMVETAPDKFGNTEIKGDVIGAFVRATTGRRPRITISKSDASHLLECRYPICVVMVHQPGESGETTLFRFIDTELGSTLASFFSSSAQTMTLRQADLLDESRFAAELTSVLQPGFVERQTLALASLSIQKLLPNTQLEIRRGMQGDVTLVRLQRFGDHFEVTEDTKLLFHAAIFGQTRHMVERLAQLPINHDLGVYLRRLPREVVFVGPIDAGEETISVTNHAGTASCDFEVRQTNDYTGWVHPSGFAITISKAMPKGNKWVHYINVEIDKDSTSELEDYPDLWAFLEQCQPDSQLHIGKLTLKVVEVGGLAPCGFFARFLRKIGNVYPWPKRMWILRDGLDEETLSSLSWLSNLDEGLDWLEGAGLVRGDADPPKHLSRFEVPVCINLRRGGVITWLRMEGYVFGEDKHIDGIQFGKTDNYEIELRETRFEKSVFPEIAIHRKWPTLQLTPKGALENPPRNGIVR